MFEAILCWQCLKVLSCWNLPIFSPYTHSPYTLSRFASYLKLSLLPEVKYVEHLLPVGQKKVHAWQSLAYWQWPAKYYRPYLLFYLMMSTKRSGLTSIVIIKEVLPSNLVKLFSFVRKVHELIQQINTIPQWHEVLSLQSEG